MAAAILHFPLVGANDNSRDIPPRSPAALARAHRKQIEELVESLIAVLDVMDGNCDLEDDDPAGDALDRGEAPSDNGQDMLPLAPIYGVDQSCGSINEEAAPLTWREQLHGRAA